LEAASDSFEMVSISFLIEDWAEETTLGTVVWLEMILVVAKVLLGRGVRSAVGVECARERIA